MPVADAKHRLRAELAAARRRVPPEVVDAAARAVAAAVVAEPRVRAARRVGLYAASHGELPTRPLFEALGELGGVTRVLPRVRPGGLEWAAIAAWGELVPGALGIPEPAGPAEPPPAPGDVLLLPGLAFDPRGHRLGRGGGHYDRAYPPGAAAPWLIGVGYAFQIVDAVPHDSRDRRVDAIVSERGWVLRAETP